MEGLFSPIFERCFLFSQKSRDCNGSWCSFFSADLAMGVVLPGTWSGHSKREASRSDRGIRWNSSIEVFQSSGRANPQRCPRSFEIISPPVMKSLEQSTLNAASEVKASNFQSLNWCLHEVLYLQTSFVKEALEGLDPNDLFKLYEGANTNHSCGRGQGGKPEVYFSTQLVQPPTRYCKVHSMLEFYMV